MHPRSTLIGAVCAAVALVALATPSHARDRDPAAERAGRHCAPRLDRGLRRDLQATLDDAIAEVEALGAVMGVSDGCRTWRLSTGEASPGGRPVRPAARMRIASITKTFVSAVVLQLDAEGAISLDDPVSAYGDWLPNGDDITVRHLLNHTSGVFDYIQDPEVLGSIFAGDGRVWSNEELVAIAVSYGPQAVPGERFSYTNTGYLLVDLIITAATGRTAGELVRERLLDPLRLRATWFASEEAVRGPLTPGWTDIGNGVLEDATHLADLSVAGAAGAMTSDTADLLDWTRLLYSGALLDRDQMAALLDTVDTGVEGTRYGLGVTVYDYDELGEFRGHTGAIWGYSSIAGYLPELDVSIVIIGNSYPIDVRFLLDRAVETVAEHVVERPVRRPWRRRGGPWGRRHGLH